MEVLAAIESRRSIRKFADKPLEDEKLQAVLEAARQAPSWANMQCWRFVVVKDAELKKSISELSFVEAFFAPKGYKINPAAGGLAQAPAVIVLCADPTQSGALWDMPYYMTDLGIASQNLMLAAHDQGLGTVFVGVFDEAKIKELLNIPANIRVVGLFPLGYPLEAKKAAPPRKPLSELVHKEKWGK